MKDLKNLGGDVGNVEVKLSEEYDKVVVVDRKIFGWPKKKQKNYDFFLPKKLTYSEVERVLNNISNCKQSNWNINHYKYIKDLMYFDKGNSQLNKIISKIIKIKI